MRHLGKLAAVLLAALAFSAPARAEVRDAELERLAAAKETLRWTQVWAGQRYGHAEALVRAPLAVLKTSLGDPGRWSALGERFSGARVLGRTGERADVLLPLQLPGATWEVLRFKGLEGAEGYVVAEGRATGANTRQGHLVVSARKVDEQRTIVKVDVLVVPNAAFVPATLDAQLRDLAADLAGGFRARAEETVTRDERVASR